MKFSWKVGDTLDNEENICDVFGKLLLIVEDQERFGMLDSMQNTVMNTQSKRTEPVGYFIIPLKSCVFQNIFRPDETI